MKPVEWAYCFDVHLNAFFPLALYIYAIQMLCWPRKNIKFHSNLCSRSYILSLCPLTVLATHSILSIMASNFIWLLAATYYIYVTFLGYTGTHIFLSIMWSIQYSLISLTCPSPLYSWDHAVLPAMHNTMPLLYFVLPLMLLFVVSIPLKWNVARGFRAFYLWRAAAH